MSNRTLAMLVLALTLALCAFAALRQHHRALQRSWIAGVAHELITTTNSPRLMFIGPGLKGRLDEILQAPTQVSVIRHGDFPGVGDGRASQHLILTNAIGMRLGIRLRPAESNKLHVVGFWTPDSSAE